MMETVRHQLVEFMLEFNKTLFCNGIDFAVMEKEKKDRVINNIYASVVHTGTGNIDASHSNNVGQGNVGALDNKSFGSIVTEHAIGAGIDKLIDKFVI